jgi:hypothetical protein
MYVGKPESERARVEETFGDRSLTPSTSQVMLAPDEGERFCGIWNCSVASRIRRDLFEWDFQSLLLVEKASVLIDAAVTTANSTVDPPHSF